MRFPLVPTIVVAAAVAVMIGLGIWQLQRKGEKEALIAQYRAASTLPPVAFPTVPREDDKLLYRRATGFCLQPLGWRSVAGRNTKDETGWSHIVSCRTGGLEGPGMQVDMGWSTSSAPPAGWKGGPVSGVIAPDRLHEIRLVSSQAAPGLVPSAAPSPEATPNNHLMYALQWFFFAAAAAVVYVLALRKRREKSPLSSMGEDTKP
jgi:cytochrome oxidase assembly protein ShyY1